MVEIIFCFSCGVVVENFDWAAQQIVEVEKALTRTIDNDVFQIIKDEGLEERVLV